MRHPGSECDVNEGDAVENDGAANGAAPRDEVYEVFID